ncbi:MAG: CBS domain-containing protein [Candidatus Doudnabacteria bacterium]|nr:CBS domain-containing protein [Candidatus Doudnabacteria bacterium]
MIPSLKDLMTKEVVAVTPETPLIKAVDLLLKGDFSGLPVIDEDKTLVGIVTDYDLVLRGSTIHLPTFLKLLKEFQVYKKDQGLIKGEIKKILTMTVADVMNAEPLTLSVDASINEAIEAFSQHHRVNPIIIVDKNHKLCGVISRFDMLKLYGSPSVVRNLKRQTDRELDQDINRFLLDFEKQFILVSKTRTHYWLLFSLLFAVIGFLIAFAIIIRITFKGP